MDDLIICVAPCPGEKQTERFPGRFDLVREVVDAAEAGATIAHVHARDRQQLQTKDVRWLTEDVRAIHERCDVIIEASTGGAPEHRLEERCVSFNVPGVELGTLNLGSINMYDGIYQNPRADIEFYARELDVRGIEPIHIVFDLSHFGTLHGLERESLAHAPHIYSFVFDVPNTLAFSQRYLEIYLEHVPSGNPWFLSRYQAPGATAFHDAIERGGHVRVGFEDGPFLASGARASSNAQLVEDIAKAAHALGRPIASPARARSILGLPVP